MLNKVVSWPPCKLDVEVKTPAGFPIKEPLNHSAVVESKNSFNGSPFSYFKPKAVNINFSHSTEQQKLFSSYIRQFGSSIHGLGTILSRSPVNYFYRNIEIYDN